jgi:hypothetical protein
MAILKSKVLHFGVLVAIIFCLISYPAVSALPSSLPIGCFSSPGACGYPDPNFNNVGAGDCSKLPNFSFANLSNYPFAGGVYYSGTGNMLEIVSSNVTVSNINLGDTVIYVSGGVNNFTLNKVCMSINGGQNEGSIGVSIPSGDNGTTVENSTISGMNATTESLGIAVANNGTNTVIENNYIYNVGGGAPGSGGGSATVENNYEDVNAIVYANGIPPTEDHYEPVYCSDNTLTISNNTLINPHPQTAEIFCNTGGGSGGACDNHLTITDNFLAGGGYMIYPCGNASSVGTSTSDIENNRFARCITIPITSQLSGGGGYTCGTTDFAGADSHGYWPYGGYYNVAAYYYTGTGQTWSNNYWDDNLDTVNIDGTEGLPVATASPVCTAVGNQQICSLASGLSLSGSLIIPASETLTDDGSICDATVQSGGILKGDGMICSLSVDNGGTVSPGHSPGIITVNGNLTESGTYQTEIQSPGDTAGTDYDQIVVTGNVNLTNGSLDVVLLNGFSPSVGQSFEIINNTGSNPITGTFSGLPEGSVFAVGNTKMQITYKGGTGNDVVLTVVSPSTKVTAIPGIPDTGFKLTPTNPIQDLVISALVALSLFYLSKRMESVVNSSHKS